MLRDQFTAFRERPQSALLAMILAIVVGLFGGLALRSDEESAAGDDPYAQTFSGASGTTGDAPSVVSPAETNASRAALLEAVQRGVELAEAGGDRASAAVWPAGWKQPIVVAGHAPPLGRMWSLSKPATAVAALQAATESGSAPSAGLKQGIKDAIRRSDNCGQRRIVLGLQQLSGNSQAKAITKFSGVLKEAGVSIKPGSIQRAQDADDVADCRTYLTSVAPLQGAANTPAAQFGTAEWSPKQAAEFAHALATDTYGSSGEYVLDAMSKPKLPPRADTSNNPIEPIQLNWGAGNVFSGWEPAYKSGWGGKATGNFSVAQLVVLRSIDPSPAIFAVVYPKAPAADENPERGTAPSGIEAILGSIKTQIESWPVQQ